MPYQVLKNEPDACASRLGKFASVATLSVALSTLLSGGTFATTLAAPPINVNGSHVAIAALERNDSVFVPVKGFFEKLGAKVTTSGSTLVATRDGKSLARMTVGDRSATINGAPQTLPVAPFVAGGVVMLPLRVIGEAAGATVNYVPAPRAVNVVGSSVAAAPVAPAAVPVTTDVASAAPVAATQTNDSGIPWWVWALLALLVLGLIVWALTRRKREPIITTTSSVHRNDSTIDTTGTSSGGGPTIRTRK